MTDVSNIRNFQLASVQQGERQVEDTILLIELSNRVDVLSSRVHNISIRADAISRECREAMSDALEAMRDKPITTCEKIGAYILCVLRNLGIIRR